MENLVLDVELNNSGCFDYRYPNGDLALCSDVIENVLGYKPEFLKIVVSRNRRSIGKCNILVMHDPVNISYASGGWFEWNLFKVSPLSARTFIFIATIRKVEKHFGVDFHRRKVEGLFYVQVIDKEQEEVSHV